MISIIIENHDRTKVYSLVIKKDWCFLSGQDGEGMEIKMSHIFEIVDEYYKNNL